jgi:hypothetical protein
MHGNGKKGGSLSPLPLRPKIVAVGNAFCKGAAMSEDLPSGSCGPEEAVAHAEMHMAGDSALSSCGRLAQLARNRAD